MFTFKVQKTLHSRSRDNKIEKMAARGGWRPFCILHCFAHLFGQGDIIFVMKKSGNFGYLCLWQPWFKIAVLK